MFLRRTLKKLTTYFIPSNIKGMDQYIFWYAACFMLSSKSSKIDVNCSQIVFFLIFSPCDWQQTLFFIRGTGTSNYWGWQNHLFLKDRTSTTHLELPLVLYLQLFPWRLLFALDNISCPIDLECLDHYTAFPIYNILWVMIRTLNVQVSSLPTLPVFSTR